MAGPRLAIADRAGLSPERLAALSVELAGLETLGDLVRWGLASSPRREVAGVVVQDEFTHDVLVTGPPGLWLCFDTT